MSHVVVLQSSQHNANGTIIPHMCGVLVTYKNRSRSSWWLQTAWCQIDASPSTIIMMTRNFYFQVTSIILRNLYTYHITAIKIMFEWGNDIYHLAVSLSRPGPSSHSVNVLNIIPFQTRADSDLDKGTFSMKQTLTSCNNMGYMCTSLLSIVYTRDDTTTAIDLSDDLDSAIINGHAVKLFSTWPEVYDINVPSVKQATSLFIIVRGFGFQILYSPNNAIYIQMDPYFQRQVRN